MSDTPESLPQTCGQCGEQKLITGYRKGSDQQEQACLNCDPDHPFSVGVRDSLAKRDPRTVDKISIEIYGRDLPELEVWNAVKRFVHETFDAAWEVDLRMHTVPDDLA